MGKMDILEHLPSLLGWIYISPSTLNLVVSELYEMSEGVGEEGQERLTSSLLVVLKVSEQFVDYNQHCNKA